MSKPPRCQLYLISPPDVSGDFSQKLDSALAAGPVAAFQLRLKDKESHELAALAQPLQEICGARDVAFIVNDNVAMAKRLKADGVHLGQLDGDPREARAELGLEAQIGITCHNSRHLAMEAGEMGADYVAFGAFYDSSTKRALHRAEPEVLRWWSAIMEIPCVAIGGITPENAAPLIEAGADFLAVSGAVWNHAGGPAAGVASFAALLKD